MTERLSLPAALLDAVLRPVLAATLQTTVKPMLSPAVPFALQRAWTSAVTSISTFVPGSVAVSAGLPGGLKGETLAPPHARDGAAVLYFHGGGYCIGSPRMHRVIGARLALATRAVVFVPDYALTPERPYPAALDDAVAAYGALRASGFDAGRIAVAGDSAGAGLALALLVALRDRGVALPAAAVLFSPWLDLTLSGATMRVNAVSDPLVSEAWLARCAAVYRGAVPADDPRVSPLFAALAGLPPLAIHVGTREILLDDAARLDVRARAAGLTVDYRRYEGLWHNSQLQAGLLPSASLSYRDATRFLAAYCS